MNTTPISSASVVSYHFTRCVKCKQPIQVPVVAPAPASAKPAERPSLAERLRERIQRAEAAVDREGKSEDDIAREMIDVLTRVTAELRAEDVAERAPAPGHAGSRRCHWCGYPNPPKVLAPVEGAPV